MSPSRPIPTVRQWRPAPRAPAPDNGERDAGGLQLIDLRGVGPARVRELSTVGVDTVEDLLMLCPLRWEDRSQAGDLQALQERGQGCRASLMLKVVEARLIRTRRRGFNIVRAKLTDGQAAVRVVWFNQPYLARHLTPGRFLWLYGAMKPAADGAQQMENPEIELIGVGSPDEEAIHNNRIVPVYRRIGRLSGRILRRLLHDVLRSYPGTLLDPLPADLLAEMNYPARIDALQAFHFPPEGTPVEALVAFRTPAQQRLIFEELYLLAVALELKRAGRRDRWVGPMLDLRQPDLARLRKMLPFPLTPGQAHALDVITADLQQPAPMARLLQGDVGCGKTILALLAMLMVVQSGRQAALMVPSEVLAEQHRLSLNRILAGTGHTVELFTSGQPAVERRRLRAGLADGSVSLVVGTHALIQDDVVFRHLGLVVIDEQHRFGVAQRLRLTHKAVAPHLLVMTATPIPRTLSLTLYGDLDSVDIRDRPPGRRPVVTTRVPASEAERVWRLVRRAVARGRQAYVVVPLVEASRKVTLSAVETALQELARRELAGIAVERLHGRVGSEEREAIMTRFASGTTQVLIATTVIEVGLDVANATVLVVLDAERFGLAQLHQLRGRIGRGRWRSICVLLHGADLTESAAQRLATLRECSDGFEIARRDLTLRGSGELLGTRQHGDTGLRIVDLVRDENVVGVARAQAAARGARFDELTRTEALARWGKRLGLLAAG